MKRLPGRSRRARRRVLPLIWTIVAVVTLALAGCGGRATSAPSGQAPASTEASSAANTANQTSSGAAKTAAGASQAAAPTPAPEQSAYPSSKLDSDVSKAPVGAKATLIGSGFPANANVALTWKTVDGRYVLEEEEVVFVGPRYDERIDDLMTVKADATGAFRAPLTVPEDFGGLHDIVARVDGKFATKTGFTVTPSFSVSSTSGPIGAPLTVTATGLGYRGQESEWEISWDNGFTGYIMGVTTHGTATANMRIAGPPGAHVLKIWRNYRGIPYLNPQQGPFGKLPEPTSFVVTATSGLDQLKSITADPDPASTVRPTPDPKSQGGGKLSLSTDKGIVGSPLALTGEGFPANQPVKLSWSTRTGQQITDTGLREGFQEDIKNLPDATAGADGRFSVQMNVPDDYAGYHRITATNGQTMAEQYFSIFASIVQFTDKAKVGDDVNIHMKGVGWTIQGKTYAITYDNVYLGYGCSFSTKGDIDLHLPAAGTPGVHIIDLYPAVYEGKDPTPNIYSRPNPSFEDNHPGGALPAFRFILTITQ
jgi:hypothetical protein